MTYPELTLRLFDRFEATHADRPLQGLKLREGERLMSYLTLNAGKPISYQELAEKFWPGEARQVLDGGGNLASTRQAIHSLRIALGPNAVRLKSPRKGTLLLDLTDANVDLLAFDRLATASDMESRRSATAMYRGPLLQDWQEPWVCSARKLREREYQRLIQELPDSSAVSLDRHEAEPQEEVRLEPIGGAVALDSLFYIVRSADAAFVAALEKADSIVLIHGARQMGKTSLLARGLNQARHNGVRVLLTDFQALSEARFASTDSLYINLAVNLSAQHEIDFSLRDDWSDDMDANLNFERFLRRRILAAAGTPVVWAMDEVDRLFAYPYASEIFGLMRSWHNRRALDPDGPWSQLTLAIAYSTEAHLFIKDSNQSPFNVGTRIALADFTGDEVAQLNRRYGSPLHSDLEMGRFRDLAGGHPYLSRAGLNALACKEYTLAQLEAAGSGDGGPFRDHLQRLSNVLKADPSLSSAISGILKSGSEPPVEIFYRLRSAGLLLGGSPSDCWIRCELYADYFARNLLFPVP